MYAVVFFPGVPGAVPWYTWTVSPTLNALGMGRSGVSGVCDVPSILEGRWVVGRQDKDT
jgi:hypothetical protein